MLLLALAAPLVGQQGATGVVFSFTNQGPWLGFEEYQVRICNTTHLSRNFVSTIVRNAAQSRGIKPASYSRIQRAIDKANRTSAARVMLSVAELGGLVMGTLTSTDAIWKPAANWQKSLPIVGAGVIRMGTTLTARHAKPEAKPPGDLLPVWVNLSAGAGSCVEHTMPAIP